QIIELGLAYNLLTRYTSFIAVHEAIRNPSGLADDVTHPSPLPKNVNDAAVGGVAVGAEPERAWLVLAARLGGGGVLLWRRRGGGGGGGWRGVGGPGPRGGGGGARGGGGGEGLLQPRRVRRPGLGPGADRAPGGVDHGRRVRAGATSRLSQPRPPVRGRPR